jgi:hypothetical protein
VEGLSSHSIVGRWMISFLFEVFVVDHLREVGVPM